MGFGDFVTIAPGGYGVLGSYQNVGVAPDIRQASELGRVQSFNDGCLKMTRLFT